MDLDQAVCYPGKHDLSSISKDEISLKIARHSNCASCNCSGLRPSSNLRVVLCPTALSTEPEDCPLLSSCSCLHGVADHGNPIDRISESERTRRAKVAVRLDELLEVRGVVTCISKTFISSLRTLTNYWTLNIVMTISLPSGNK